MSSIVTIEVAGIKSALHAMRNPYDSWEKSDTIDTRDKPIRGFTKIWKKIKGLFKWIFSRGKTVEEVPPPGFYIGPADRKLSTTLAQAGTEHCKHLRMIEVWADISMPLYWWKQFDTYRFGVEKVSCSTMHKIHSRFLEIDDFQFVSNDNQTQLKEYIIPRLNDLIKRYNKSKHKDKEVWYTLVGELPSNYIQKRTVMMSYAVLRQMYSQRKGHKLNEWEYFREWIHTLPESWMITDDE